MRKLIPFLCVFAYYASPYRLMGYVLPELICLLAAMMQFVYTQRSYLSKEYICFMLYMWLIPPIVSVAVGLPGAGITSFLPLGLILTSINIAILLPNVNCDLVVKYYRLLVYIAIGFFVLQELSFFTTGFRPTFYLNFLESYYDGSNITEFAMSRSEMNRSSSFFLEPSHFVQYIIPYACFVVCQSIQNKKMSIELPVMFLVIVWSKTGAGFLCLALIVAFVFLFNSRWHFFIKLSFLIAVIVVVSVALTYFSDNVIVSEVLRRSTEFSLTVDAHGQQSGFFRIWRGYYIYAAGDPLNQLFGTATSSIEYVASKVYISGIDYQGTYMNGIQSLLMQGGVVGTVLFSVFIWKFCKTFSMSSQCVIFTMIGLFFIENMLYSPKMFLFILVAYCINKFEKKNYQKKETKI